MGSSVVNIVVAGLGGQGVIKASDIIADAAFRAGHDVKKSEIHGMSQRGGSVTSDIRFGERVLSPMVPPGEADFLLVIAPDQVENNRYMLKPKGILIDPDWIDAGKLRSARSANVALVGCLSALLQLDMQIWLESLRANLPTKGFESNELAFNLGREACAMRRPRPVMHSEAAL
jgi:indolepyruvate ferredoxin oxidoreductase beta subunit